MRTVIGLMLGAMLAIGCGSANEGEDTAVGIAPLIDSRGSTGSGSGRLNIAYHGGPVLLGTVNTYAIWYGDWSNNTATTILPDMLSNIGNSPYFNINTGYYSTPPTQYVSGAVSYAGSVSVGYSHGTSLTSAMVQQVVADVLSASLLPTDTNAVYFVLTSKDVKVGDSARNGFCSSYCGYHNFSAGNVKYAFVGDASQQCPSGCEWQPTVSPNNNPGLDGMISVVAHELNEATTDPTLQAWYSTSLGENSDQCAWRFSPTYTVSNGSLANVRLGTRDYLIQQNLVNASPLRCALHL